MNMQSVLAGRIVYLNTYKTFLRWEIKTTKSSSVQFIYLFKHHPGMGYFFPPKNLNIVKNYETLECNTKEAMGVNIIKVKLTSLTTHPVTLTTTV
jgi:hypothetical protein